MPLSDAWPLVAHAALLAVPTTFALFGAFAPRRAALATGVAAFWLVLLAGSSAMARGAAMAANLGVRLDAVAGVMLVLVVTLASVIVRYSLTSLHGDAGLARYLRWLLLTLSAVTALVVANNLLVVVLAWTATSIALHQLLTFYPGRAAALVAAHKKFLVSRLADVSLAACLVLVNRSVGSLDIDAIARWADAHPALTPSMHVAAVLVVLAVALKSAQLPFHGWLTQVMEAPTPVSALLHAGIVNMGGVVLIRLAGWMVHAELAMLLLVLIGLVSVTVGALVMTTRVSIKVSLAWSTCAQMGFMLVQCGLGLWQLALLHIVAHSLYKAHAFLSAGGAVEDWRLAASRERACTPSWRRAAMAFLAAAAGAGLALAGARQLVGPQAIDPSLPVFTILVSLSLVPLFATAPRGIAHGAATAVRVAAVVLLYVGWHVVANRLLPVYDDGPSRTVGAVLAGTALVGLHVVKTTLSLFPDGRFARALYPWLFAGFYVDERFTRLTFRLWPPRLQSPPEPPRTSQLRAALEGGP